VFSASFSKPPNENKLKTKLHLFFKALSLSFSNQQSFELTKTIPYSLETLPSISFLLFCFDENLSTYFVYLFPKEFLD